MNWLIIVFIVWTVVSAVAEPSPAPVVGLFTQSYNKINANSVAGIQQIDKLINKYYLDLLNYIRAAGGPGYNTDRKIKTYSKLADELWANIVDIYADNTWNLQLINIELMPTLKNKFGLVVDQPLVRSWLCELSDLIRVNWNSVLQTVNQYRAEWDNLAGQVGDQLADLISAGLCHCPDLVQERFYQIIRYIFVEAANIIKQMVSAINAYFNGKIVERGYALHQNIYNAEIIRLKYFVNT